MWCWRVIILAGGRIMETQKAEEIRQQAQPHAKPHALQLQGRDGVTAEGMVSRAVQGT